MDVVQVLSPVELRIATASPSLLCSELSYNAGAKELSIYYCDALFDNYFPVR